MTLGKILVVKDHPLNQELVVTALEAHGYTVLEAEDGLGLLERVKAERPALIIMDLQLPRIDGFTLTQQLKTDAETRDIPILAASSFAKFEDQARALGLAVQPPLPSPSIWQSFLRPLLDFCHRAFRDPGDDSRLSPFRSGRPGRGGGILPDVVVHLIS